MFIPAFTRAHHMSVLSQIDPVHAPHLTSLRSILILSSHLRLCRPSALLPSGLSIKTLYAPLLSPVRATCLTYISLLDLITLMCSANSFIFEHFQNQNWSELFKRSAVNTLSSYRAVNTLQACYENQSVHYVQ